MRPFSFLKRLWPRDEASLVQGFPHPAEEMISPEIKRYLENHNWRNLRYPPYQEGYPGLVSGEWFMRSYQKELLNRILHSIGMPASELALYVEPILVNFAELAHMLPASENHHHSGPGGLLRHSLEVAALTLDGCLTTAFDNSETPARRSMRLRRWYVAGIAAGLLHDSGKPLTDIRATDFEGNNQWIYAQETLHEWSVRHNLPRYFLHWIPGRHGNHVQVSVAQATRIIPPAVLAWMIEGGHDIYEAMLDAISGAGSSPLTELVKRADSASTKRDLNRGDVNGGGGGTGVPVPRLVSDAMLRLLADGTWTVNTPGSRVWVAPDGVYIAWNQGAAEIVQMLVGDGVVAIPRSPDTLIGTLVDHGIAERAPNGELYWLVTPHVLRKNGSGPALRCMKLVNADMLFPTTPIPPPISISLGKEGQQTEVIAPNDTAPAVAAQASSTATEDESPAASPSPAVAPATDEKTNTPSSPKPAKRQAASVPSTPTSGVKLNRSTPPADSLDPAPLATAETEPQPEEATPETGAEADLEGMLLFLSGQDVQAEAMPPLDSEGQQETAEAEPEAASEATAHEPPARQEKISLHELLGKRTQKPKAAAPATTAPPEKPQKPAARPETGAAAISESLLPTEVAAQLTAHEIYLLEKQPELARKLITSTRQPENAAFVRSKVFIALDRSAFHATDIQNLVGAGWLWQDISVEGPALTRLLNKREGFVLTPDYSLIFTKLAALDWEIAHPSRLPEADLPVLERAVKALIEKSSFEEIGGVPVIAIPTFCVRDTAAEFGVTPEALEYALLALRDCVKASKRRRFYVRPNNEELPQK